MATLITQDRIDTSITGAAAYRVRYHSRDLRGRFTESTGLVIVPEAAHDGRVMTWCHGTTGTITRPVDSVNRPRRSREWCRTRYAAAPVMLVSMRSCVMSVAMAGHPASPAAHRRVRARRPLPWCAGR